MKKPVKITVLLALVGAIFFSCPSPLDRGVTVEMPTSSFDFEQEYTDEQSIDLVATGGNTIRYTTDGSNPTSSHGTVYTSPIVLSLNTQLKAVAYNGDGDVSLVAVFGVEFKAQAPQIDNPGGTWLGGTTSTITVPAGTQVYYTTDGTDPSPSNGILYSSQISITENTDLRAVASEPGKNLSDIDSSQINVRVKSAFPNPHTHTHSGPISVTLNCGTVGATMKYTLDGSTPSQTNGIVYTGAFTVSSSITFRTIAIKDNMVDSQVYNYYFTIN
jgi:hypothetical protein